MTLSTLDNRESYSGNGVTTNFSFPNYFLADEDLVVILRVEATGVETTKVLTTDYTVSGEGNPTGGTVTMLVAPATGETLTIYRDPAATQELDLVENDNLPAESVEEELDKLTMLVQRLADKLARSAILTEGYSAAFDPTFPSLIVGDTVLAFNVAGDGFATGPSITDIANAAANAAAAAASAAASAASASASASSATAAAASATAAQAAVDSIYWHDVVFKTFADSPVSIGASDRGKLYSIDASGGAMIVNLPQISGLDLTSAYVVGFKKTDSGANTITVNAYNAGDGTDKIDGANFKTISTQNQGSVLVPDIDTAPDSWTGSDFGAGAVADDSVTVPKLNAQVTQPQDVMNYDFAASVAANALTITLRTHAGLTPSASDPVQISFRDSSASNSGYLVRKVTAATSVVISSGSTLGHTSGANEQIWLYALDNAGTVELAVSSSRTWDESNLQSTTAEGGAGAADSRTAIYSTTARSGKAVRLIGRIDVAEATAGTWATAPFQLNTTLSNRYKAENSEVCVDTPNGHGSTNTKIRIFSNVITNTGSDISYVTSATLGDSFTINKDGIYAINYQDSASNNAWAFGISKNTTQPTTSIVTANGAVSYTMTNFQNFCPVPVPVTMRLKVGDVIRPHTNGLLDAVDPIANQFRITKLSD